MYKISVIDSSVSYVYDEITIISFETQGSVLDDVLPINFFVVDIKIDDTSHLQIGNRIKLLKDNTLLASYFITDVYRANSLFVRVEAKSVVAYLDRDILPAEMYSNESFANIVDSIFYNTEQVVGTIHQTDNSLTETITGFCPQQSARQRLQWVCFIAGARVKTEFFDSVQILPIDYIAKFIPASLTFWRPNVTYKDYVTAVRVKYYSYVVGTPTATDDWVYDGTNYYIQTEGETTIVNTDAPSGIAENIIEYSNITIVNPNNVNTIATRIGSIIFNRVDVDASIVNANSFQVMDRVQISDGTKIIDGFVEQSSYSFGHNSKTKLLIQQYEEIVYNIFSLFYVYGATLLKSYSESLPEGYQYYKDIDYLDYYLVAGVRAIYRTDVDHISFTMPATTHSETVNCYMAVLDEGGEVTVYNADTAEYRTGGVFIG